MAASFNYDVVSLDVIHEEDGHPFEAQDQSDNEEPEAKKARGEFVCDCCEATYSDLRSLRRHQTQRRVPCTECKETFARPDILKRHMRRRHPEEVGPAVSEISPGDQIFDSSFTQATEVRTINDNDWQARFSPAVPQPNTLHAGFVEAAPHGRKLSHLIHFEQDWSQGVDVNPSTPVNQDSQGDFAEWQPANLVYHHNLEKNGVKEASAESASFVSASSDTGLLSPFTAILPYRSGRPGNIGTRNPRPVTMKLPDTCPLCAKEFGHSFSDRSNHQGVQQGASGSEVLQHLQKHLAAMQDPSSRVTCSICHVEFVHQKDLDWHVGMCDRGDCGFKFGHVENCVGHHPPSQEKRFQKQHDLFVRALRSWEQAQMDAYREYVAAYARGEVKTNAPLPYNNPWYTRSDGSILTRCSGKTHNSSRSNPLNADFRRVWAKPSLAPRSALRKFLGRSSDSISTEDTTLADAIYGSDPNAISEALASMSRHSTCVELKSFIMLALKLRNPNTLQLLLTSGNHAALFLAQEEGFQRPGLSLNFEDIIDQDLHYSSLDIISSATEGLSHGLGQCIACLLSNGIELADWDDLSRWLRLNVTRAQAFLRGLLDDETLLCHDSIHVRSLLAKAVELGLNDLLACFLEAKADFTGLLRIAVDSRRASTAELLIERGVDLDGPRDTLQNALDLALHEQQINLLSVLVMSHPSLKSDAITKALAASSDTLQWLLNQKLDCHTWCMDMTTPLDLALRQQDVPKVKLLLRHTQVLSEQQLALCIHLAADRHDASIVDAIPDESMRFDLSGSLEYVLAKQSRSVLIAALKRHKLYKKSIIRLCIQFALDSDDSGILSLLPKEAIRLSLSDDLESILESRSNSVLVAILKCCNKVSASEAMHCLHRAEKDCDLGLLTALPHSAFLQYGAELLEHVIFKRNRMFYRTLLEHGALVSTKLAQPCLEWAIAENDRSIAVYLYRYCRESCVGIQRSGTALPKWLYRSIHRHEDVQDPDDESQILMHAIRTHQAASVDVLLRFDLDCDAFGRDGQTPLYYAIKQKNRDVLATLEDLGKVNSCTLTLILAVERRDRDAVMYLLWHGADANAKDCQGRSALTIATETAEVMIMEQLLRYKAHVQDNLLVAVQQGKIGSASLLLRYGADSNDDHGTGRSALDSAMVLRNGQMLELLLDHGGTVAPNDATRAASIILKTDTVNHRCLFETAVRQRNATAAKLLISYKQLSLEDRQAYLSIAIDQNYSEMIQPLLAPILAGLGQTRAGLLLEKAISQPAGDILPQLLRHISPLQVKCSDGSTLLCLAVRLKATVHVRRLIEHGADVDAKSETGEIPLATAARLGSKEIVHLLIAKDARLNAQGRHGQTALHAAVLAGQYNVAKELLEYGAQTEIEDDQGDTVLMAACKNKSSNARAFIRLLLDHRADCNAEGGEYGSALAAVLHNNPDCSDLLLRLRRINLNVGACSHCGAPCKLVWTHSYAR